MLPETDLFILKLSGADLDGNHFCCTGPQVAMVLQALIVEPALAACTWYAGAIETYPEFGLHEGAGLELIADVFGLIDKLRATRQLLDGVFVAVPCMQLPGPTPAAIEKFAENAMVRVVAYDTSWIEIQTGDVELAACLQSRFARKS